MSQVIVRQLLEQRLASLSPALATAWENNKFVRTLDAPHQVATLLPANSENPTMGGGSVQIREYGVLHVMLKYPVGTGAGAAQARAELLRSHFPRGLVLTSGNVRVSIHDTPSVAQH